MPATLSFEIPEPNAVLSYFARVRIAASDTTAIAGADLQLFLDDFQIPISFKRVAGEALGGEWELALDTRDYSSGAHTLRALLRGVEITRAVSIQNTLQGGVFYRDLHSDGREGLVVGQAHIGLETRALDPNSSRKYWIQSAVRSGTELDGTYQGADWAKHQPVVLTLGESQHAQRLRFERRNWSAPVTFRLPWQKDVRYRRKYTPQWLLTCFDLLCQSVPKIRTVAPGQHFIWTQNPARAHLYNGQTVQLLGDFGDASKPNFHAPDALDGALWNGDGGRKIIVVAPTSPNAPGGEVFAFDPDAGEIALTYSVRGESYAARFVEVVAGAPIVLYVGATTRAYDLTFGAPKPKWELPDAATFASEEGAKLFVACGSKLYSSDGQTLPVLVRDFGANVTSANGDFVGLQNGQVWKKSSAGWGLVLTRSGTIGGALAWLGGTNGESATDPARGVVGGAGHWLVGERVSGSWFDERELVAPLDVSAGFARVASLAHFSVEIPVPVDPLAPDATPARQFDERLLVGTGEAGLLFVYQRSALSEKDGAIGASCDSVPRIFPFPSVPPKSQGLVT